MESTVVSTLSAAQVSERRESVVAALTSPDLASIVDLVVWAEADAGDPLAGPVAMAASHVGRVRLHRDGRHQVELGRDPIASEDAMAFLPYDRECASPAPATSRQNAYPYAASRILSLFADPDRSPDVAVMHTPGHFFPERGGHVGEHGSLDVIQSRAPLLLSGNGVGARGIVDAHAKLVDVCPTLATLAGVPGTDLRDAAGSPLDGSPLTAYLSGQPPARPKVIGMLWDGAHCGDLLHLAESGQLPDPATSIHLHDTAHLHDSYYSWATQVDDLGLEQMRTLWGSLELAPTLTWWASVVSDAGHHAGGPRSDIARDSLRDADSRLVSFLEHLDGLGVTDHVSFLLTADHGFEGSDPTVTGSWQPALERLGIPFRDEGPGFIYLLPDGHG